MSARSSRGTIWSRIPLLKVLKGAAVIEVDTISERNKGSISKLSNLQYEECGTMCGKHATSSLDSSFPYQSRGCVIRRYWAKGDKAIWSSYTQGKHE